jgi:GntR family transcriptional regulator, transcriptional repressor for pyruvate dehydrogenase complex
MNRAKAQRPSLNVRPADTSGTADAIAPWYSEQIPLRQRTIADQVVERIIELIKYGSLRAGDRLPSEGELTSAFRISRPSVREGLKMLCALGIVESRQGGRYYITDLSPTRLIEPLQFVVLLHAYDVDAHLEARTAIDLILVKLACERAQQDEIRKIQLLAKDGHRFTSDPIGFRLLDFEFHRTINGAAGNALLARISQSLYELEFEFRRVATETPGVIARSIADHDVIARAIAARDPRLAERAFRRHLENVRDSTIEAQRVIEARYADRGGKKPRAKRHVSLRPSRHSTRN